MGKVGLTVDPGEYPVSLQSVTAKTKPNGDDSITFKSTIRDEDSQFNGMPLFRTFTIKNDPDADNAGVLYYMQQAFLAFGADEEAVTSNAFDPEQCAKSEGLIGARALATVTHRPNDKDPAKPFLSVEFKQSDF